MRFSFKKVIFSSVSGPNLFLKSVCISPVELNKHSLGTDLAVIQKIPLAILVRIGYETEFALKNANGPKALFISESYGNAKKEFLYWPIFLFNASSPFNSV